MIVQPEPVGSVIASVCCTHTLYKGHTSVDSDVISACSDRGGL